VYSRQKASILPHETKTVLKFSYVVSSCTHLFEVIT